MNFFKRVRHLAQKAYDEAISNVGYPTWYNCEGFGFHRNVYSDRTRKAVEAAMEKIDPEAFLNIRPLGPSEGVSMDGGGMMMIDRPLYVLEFQGLKINIPVLQAPRFFDALLQTEPHPTEQIQVPFVSLVAQISRILLSPEEREAALDSMSPHMANLRIMADEEAGRMSNALKDLDIVDETGAPVDNETIKRNYLPTEDKSIN